MSGTDDFRKLTQAQVEEMAAPLYRGLGRALARWQHVEAGMFLLSHAIFGTDYKFSSTAFYMLKGANMKLDLLDRLCQAHFSSDIITNEWKPTLKELRAALDFRNGLAHFEVNYITDPAVLKNGDPPVGLSPHHLDVRESAKPTVRLATVTDLNQAAELYLRLSRHLFGMVQRHFPLEKLRSTHLPPPILQFLATAQTHPQGQP
jgi:hypothetical protein